MCAKQSCRLTLALGSFYPKLSKEPSSFQRLKLSQLVASALSHLGKLCTCMCTLRTPMTRNFEFRPSLAKQLDKSQLREPLQFMVVRTWTKKLTGQEETTWRHQLAVRWTKEVPFASINLPWMIEDAKNNSQDSDQRSITLWSRRSTLCDGRNMCTRCVTLPYVRMLSANS